MKPSTTAKKEKIATKAEKSAAHSCSNLPVDAPIFQEDQTGNDFLQKKKRLESLWIEALCWNSHLCRL